LNALTVDIKTVKLPDTSAAAAAAKAAPPAVRGSSLRPMSLNYTSTLNMQGREMKIESTRVLAKEKSDGKSVWKLTQTAKTPMGDGTDIYLLDEATLAPISRSATQGGAKVDMTFSDSEVKGMISAGAQQIPISGKLEGAVFGDEAALEASLSALPLAPGYKTTYRTFDMMGQKSRVWSLEVTGTEKVTVPAGTFDTYKVEIKAIDGGEGGSTRWITTAQPRMVIAAEGSLPAAMGGGKIRSELTGKN
jgi:hypothetical protein